jgi:hypothetical protein
MKDRKFFSLHLHHYRDENQHRSVEGSETWLHKFWCEVIRYVLYVISTVGRLPDTVTTVWQDMFSRVKTNKLVERTAPDGRPIINGPKTQSVVTARYSLRAVLVTSGSKYHLQHTMHKFGWLTPCMFARDTSRSESGCGHLWTRLLNSLHWLIGSLLRSHNISVGTAMGYCLDC